jgi:hypothetical protein
MPRNKFKLFKLAKIDRTKIVSNNFSNSYNEGVAVVIQSPSRRVVRLKIRDFEDQDYANRKECNGNFFLSLPAVYFRIHYICGKNKKYLARNLHVVFANNKNILIPPLPNIDFNMRVCIPLPQKGFVEIDDLCSAVVFKFWSSQFTDDILENYESYDSKSILGDFRKWHNKTKTNPDWIPNRGFKVIDEKRQKFSGITNDFFYGESFKKDIIPDDDDFGDADDYDYDD